jgi:hypothetical protein
MGSGIFFARRLDRANQLEMAREIRLRAQAETRPVTRMSAATCGIQQVKVPDIAKPVIGRAFALPV